MGHENSTKFDFGVGCSTCGAYGGQEWVYWLDGYRHELEANGGSSMYVQQWWVLAPGGGEIFPLEKKIEDDDDDNDEEVLTFSSSSHACDDEDKEKEADFISTSLSLAAPRKKAALSSKLRSALALTLFGKRRSHLSSGLGTRVIGTLFGYRRGHVHFAFQEDPKSHPAFLMELATSTSVLVREMASGLVRIALECDKKVEMKKRHKIAGGASLEDVLQRQEMWVCHEERMWSGGVEGVEGGRANFNGRWGVAREWRNWVRGRAHVHESQV
ncbi:Protein MIZU-KUSSEI 1 [Vitis vinifera]|uniref:Protein MIZU-KUSSEI 1 n=1 Tax=Vitis vinifera TaxID=29760 RepID=A0A438ED13_VITVI|nr:Protein MIZU-KUSSEI 1 [Vitis vinifera]